MSNKNIQLQVRSMAEELNADEAAVVFRNLEDGFQYTMPEFSLKNTDFEKFLSEVSSEICALEKFDYSSSKNHIVIRYDGEDLRFYTRGNSKDIVINAYANSEEIANKVWKIYLKNSPSDEDIDIFMTSFSMAGNRLDEATRDIEPKALDYISASYYPYIDIDIMFEQFFTGAENILLLVGDPGLGKSKMSTLALKHAYNNPDKIPHDKIDENPALSNQFISCAYVKSIDVLVNDQFWRLLEQQSMDFVIIDDLDFMLTKRDSDVSSQEDIQKNIFLNQFLSFTDGVEKNKTKFIITTNQKYTDIDTAVLRKGRLFDIIELRHLSKDEGKKIWAQNNLDLEEFDEVFCTHEILAADLGSEISKRKNNRINSATDSYLKEEGISKVHKIKSKKRIGL